MSIYTVHVRLEKLIIKKNQLWQHGHTHIDVYIYTHMHTQSNKHSILCKNEDERISKYIWVSWTKLLSDSY